MPDEYDKIFNEIKNISGLKEGAIKTKTAIRLSIEYPTPDFVKEIWHNVNLLDNENR